MKNSIKLSALLLLAGTGIFAAGATAKPIHPMSSSIKGMVTFSTIPTRRGVEIKVKENPGKALVIIYNYENDMVWKDILSNKKGMDKSYVLSQLDNGNYTIEVTLNKQVVKKIAHVYYKGDSKLVTIRG
jgi:hypothetical protein